MNISEKTILSGIEKTKCSVGHIQQCLNNPKMHGNLSFDYFGKVVQRGTVDLYTKNGVFTASFSCTNGWLKELIFYTTTRPGERGQKGRKRNENF